MIDIRKSCPVCGSSYQTKLEKAFDKTLKEICDLYSGEVNCQPCPADKEDIKVCKDFLRRHYLKDAK